MLDERRLLRTEPISGPGHAYPPCVVSWFEDQAERYESRLAISHGDERLTYGELNGRANQLARALREQWNSPSRAPTVALLYEHGSAAMVAMLATLKLGWPYVPMDPGEAPARLRGILSDCDAELVLAGARSQALAESAVSDLAHGCRVIRDAAFMAGSQRSGNLGCDVDPLAPAYILYTSGSTGRPKGVVQTRQYITQLARSFTTSIGLCESDRISLLAPLTFSAAVMDLFGGLLSGAGVCGVDVKAAGLRGIARALVEHRVTVLHCVPSLFRSLARVCEPTDLSSIRLVYLAGEPTLQGDVELYRHKFVDDCVLVNALGCTEFNVCRQFFMNKATQLESSTVPVGGPALDVDVLLLDESRQLTPMGEVGEIAIRSKWLSARYHNAAELTAERFVSDHCASGERLYLTGDLGRLSQTGCLTHLGRKDDQVKIRGQRVELGEIESALLSVPSVTQAAVVGIGDFGQTELWAYHTSDASASDASASEHQLRASLRRLVPECMVPTHLIRVDDLPRTHTGKVDRAELKRRSRRPEVPRAVVARSLGETQQVVLAIWERHLSHRPIGFTDNLFDIGGNSLLALELHAALESTLDVAVTLVDLFKYPTIATLAEFLRAAPAVTPLAFEPGN